MSDVQLNQTFRCYLEEIMYSTVKIEDPYDRVTVMQWIRKLQGLDDSSLQMAKLRNQYADYLRILLSSDAVKLSVPFKKQPPEEDLRPLCEVLANHVARTYPKIPMTGPIEPIMSQTSEDGKVYTAVRQYPGGGLYCYLAVTPEGFEGLSKE